MTAPKSKSLRQIEPLNAVLAVLAIAGVASCAVVTWLRLQSKPYDAAISAEITAKQQAAINQKKQATVPELKLNQDYERQGPTVVVNPSNTGKQDPFQ